MELLRKDLTEYMPTLSADDESFLDEAGVGMFDNALPTLWDIASDAAYYQQENEELEDEVHDLNNEIDDLKTERDELQDKYDDKLDEHLTWFQVLITEPELLEEYIRDLQNEIKRGC